MSQIDLPRRNRLDAITSEPWTASDWNRWTPCVRYAWTASLESAVTSSVAQQIVPFAAKLAEPSRRGATIGTVMSGLLCGILFGRVLGGAVGDHYGWRAMFWLGLLLAVAVGLLLAAVFPRSHPKT
jgi:predicted MFS family arabinose efflux permease